MNEDTNVCVICFECKKQNETTVKMNSQEVYMKFCPCNICIHISCLEMWFNENGSCPICHEQMSENNWYEYTYGFYIIHYLIFLKPYVRILTNNIIKFKNVFIFFYLLANLIFTIERLYNINYLQNKTPHYEEPPQIL
jgi:hypothetical protein